MTGNCEGTVLTGWAKISITAEKDRAVGHASREAHGQPYLPLAYGGWGMGGGGLGEGCST